MTASKNEKDVILFMKPILPAAWQRYQSRSIKLLMVRVFLKILDMVVRIIAVSIPVQSMPVPVSSGSRSLQGANSVRCGDPSEVNEVAEK